MLSKTDFLLYLEAPMHLWAKAHDALEKTTLTPYDQHLIQQGQHVESLARAYIEDVLLPQYGSGQLFWQAVYDDGRYAIRTDALILDQASQRYDLYEIKSSTSVHIQHEIDVTFQVLLLESILNLRNVYILHVDKTYQQGNELNIEKFFTLEEISDKVEKRREDVDRWRKQAWDVTQMDDPLPTFACTKPQTCPCPSLCHPDLPKHSIFDIPYIGRKAAQLRDLGVTAIREIPPNFDLNAKQKKHVQAVKSRKALIDWAAIQESLSRLQFPLYFLDYETFNPAVPLYPGYQPYEHIVFQYSLYSIAEPGAPSRHVDCLITEGCDPAPKIVPHLMNNLMETGSVVVWNQTFEEGRNRDLAVHCTDYAERLLGINKRLFDLMKIFKDGHYVHPDFHGSVSLKVVLPVLCPDLNYEELAISNGEQAMLTWYWLQQGEVPLEQRAEIEAAMREYCKRDTYGMVAIWEQLSAL
jgi:hypothetical protein